MYRSAITRNIDLLPDWTGSVYTGLLQIAVVSMEFYIKFRYFHFARIADAKTLLALL
jgi:hypothetical protein